MNLKELKNDLDNLILPIVNVLIIILIVCLAIWLINYIHTEDYKCISNPLVYGVSKYKSNTDAEFYCSCSAFGSEQSLYVTKDNLSVVDNYLFTLK